MEEQYGPDRTILTLLLAKKKVKKQAKKISEKNERNKTSEISKALGLSETRIRAILKEMADEGEIFTGGSTKKKSYYLQR